MPFCKALQRMLGEDYHFVATDVMPETQRNLGYADLYPDAPFALNDFGEQSLSTVRDSDVLILGSAPEHFLRTHLNAGKLAFRYSERPLKKGLELKKFLPRLILWRRRNPMSKPLYLLCASAYTAGDYAQFGLFRNRCYKWGYFPETLQYTAEELFSRKQNTVPTLLWVGRLIDWKHPDDALSVARQLKAAGYAFRLNIIGIGQMEDSLRADVAAQNLEDCVSLLGSMPPEDVRKHMENANIFLFTSDRQEGWGAVLNEAMNSGCALVASDAIGAVPYLLRHKENGCVYHSGDVDGLARQIRELLENKEESRKLGAAAYRTVAEQWNGEIAARRLIHLTEKLLAGEKRPELYEDGPCSPAPTIREDWFKK